MDFARKHAAAKAFAISFIRTVTVGSGIAPDLLTSTAAGQVSSARGLLQLLANTAGGEFRPALRTLPTF